MGGFCVISECQYHGLGSENHCSRYEKRVKDCPKYKSEDNLLFGDVQQRAKSFKTGDFITSGNVPVTCNAPSDSKTCGTKFDNEKPRYELMSPFAIENLARVLTLGAKKYGDRNWEDGIKFSRIIGACERHIAAIKRGEDFDIGPNGDGELHSAHLLCEAMFLTEYYKIAPEFDDRPVRCAKRIGLDIDDVLCDFAGTYCREYGMETPKAWQFDPKFKERYAELCNNWEWFLNLPRICDPDDLPFEPIVYITARGCDKAMTERWIYDNGFPTAPVVQVNPGTSKVNACREFKLDIFIDDSFSNFTELTKAGIFTYLFTREHNKRYNVGHRRLDKLQDIFMGEFYK